MDKKIAKSYEALMVVVEWLSASLGIQCLGITPSTAACSLPFKGYEHQWNGLAAFRLVVILVPSPKDIEG